MFKSSSQLLSVVLGFGLISSNFFTLMILARKDSGIPNLATLPSNKYSSFSIRSDKEGNKHSWTMASNQHDPKKLLYTKEETRPGFKGTTKSYIHKESVAYSTPVIQYQDKELTAKQIECMQNHCLFFSMFYENYTKLRRKCDPYTPTLGPTLAKLYHIFIFCYKDLK